MWNRPPAPSSVHASRNLRTNKDSESQSVADTVASRRSAIRRRTRRYGSSSLPGPGRNPRSNQQVLLDLLSYSTAERVGSTSPNNSERDSSVRSSRSSAPAPRNRFSAALAEARLGIDGARREISDLARLLDEPSLMQRYTSHNYGGMHFSSLIDAAPPPSIMRRLNRSSPPMPSSRNGNGLPAAWDSTDIYSSRLGNPSGRFPREDVDLYERESSRRGIENNREIDWVTERHTSRDHPTTREAPVGVPAPINNPQASSRRAAATINQRLSSMLPASQNSSSTMTSTARSSRTLNGRQTHDPSQVSERLGGSSERDVGISHHLYAATAAPSLPTSFRNWYVIDGLGDRERSLSPDSRDSSGNSDSEEHEVEESDTRASNGNLRGDYGTQGLTFEPPATTIYRRGTSDTLFNIHAPAAPPHFFASSSPISNSFHDSIICDYPPYSSDSEDSNDGAEAEATDNGQSLSRPGDLPWGDLWDRLSDRSFDRNESRVALVSGIGNWHRLGIGRLSEGEAQRESEEARSLAATASNSGTRTEGI